MKKLYVLIPTVLLLILALFLTFSTFLKKEGPRPIKDDTLMSLPEGAIRRIGKGSINQIAYSPDGQKLAVASSIGIWIYDANTTEALNLFPIGRVLSVSFSRDGNTIASANYGNTVKMWDAHTGNLLNTLTDYTNSTWCVSFSPDGKTLAMGNVDRLSHTKNTTHIQDTVQVRDAQTGDLISTFIGHTDSIRSISFSPDGKTIVSGSSDRTARVWDVQTGDLISTFTTGTSTSTELKSRINDVCFSPDGKTVVSASADHTVRLFDSNTGQHLKTFMRGGAGEAVSVSFSPDGQTLAIGIGRQAYGNTYNTVQFYDVNTSRLVNTIAGHTGAVNEACFSPDGQTIVSGASIWGDSEDNTLRVWNPHTGNLIRTIATHINSGLTSLTFSPNGDTIIKGNAHDPVQTWDAHTGNLITTPIAHIDSVSCIAFSRDGTMIAAGGFWDWDQTVKVWDTHTGDLISTLTEHSDQVEAISFSPDGKPSPLAVGTIL